MTSTITLKGDHVRKEGEASEAITPGMLIEFGGTNDLRKHATEAGPGRKAFALENDLVGEGIDDAYASGDTVQYGVFPPGAEVYALLDGGENASVGSQLMSSGDGSLKVVETEAQQDSIIAWAIEDKNNSATSAGGAHARIKVEVA